MIFKVPVVMPCLSLSATFMLPSRFNRLPSIMMSPGVLGKPVSVSILSMILMPKSTSDESGNSGTYNVCLRVLFRVSVMGVVLPWLNTDSLYDKVLKYVLTRVNTTRYC